jgi:1-acyl-sn-glycerol-3-phosphate acyltransferase
MADQAERDRRDATRDLAPMAPARDALVIDTTHLTPHEVIDRLEARRARRPVVPSPLTAEGTFAVMSDRPGLVGRLWYDTVYWSSFTAFTFGFSLRRRGWAHVPPAGPGAAARHHQSMFDPVLVGLASRRYLSYLARKTLFEQPGLAPLIRSLNAIPIDRNMGKDGIQAVLDALGQGQAVLMFPEGERTHDGAVHPLKPGVSLLIKRVSCPIVPVGIAGAFAAWSRFMRVPKLSPLLLPPGPSALAVSVGAPIDPARYAGGKREAMLDDLYRALVRQHADAERLRRK